MKPAISEVCTLNSPFERDVEDYAAAVCKTIELWLGKLEGFLSTHSLDQVRELLAQHGVSAPVASYQGGILLSQGEARREHWKSFDSRLTLCSSLGVETLVVAGDLNGPIEQQDLERVLVSLREAAERAADSGLRIALEFQARASLANNLQSAVSLVEQVGHAALGLCLDMFHFYTGPSKHEDLGLLTTDNLFHVQLCDLAGQARELATDQDRILPGDGDFVFEPLLNRLRDIGYSGCVSVELMNPQLWLTQPRQFAEIAITALRRLLGQASMG